LSSPFQFPHLDGTVGIGSDGIREGIIAGGALGSTDPVQRCVVVVAVVGVVVPDPTEVGAVAEVEVSVPVVTGIR